MSRYEIMKGHYEYHKSKLKDDEHLEMFVVVPIGSSSLPRIVRKVTGYCYSNEHLEADELLYEHIDDYRPTISYKIWWGDSHFDGLVDFHEPPRGVPYYFKVVPNINDKYEDTKFELVDIQVE